jgi:hypothetical protein
LIKARDLSVSYLIIKNKVFFSRTQSCHTSEFKRRFQKYITCLSDKNAPTNFGPFYMHDPEKHGTSKGQLTKNFKKNIFCIFA